MLRPQNLHIHVPQDLWGKEQVMVYTASGFSCIWSASLRWVWVEMLRLLSKIACAIHNFAITDSLWQPIHIIELVDSISRDGPDTPKYVIHYKKPNYSIQVRSYVLSLLHHMAVIFVTSRQAQECPPKLFHKPQAVTCKRAKSPSSLNSPHLTLPKALILLCIEIHPALYQVCSI